MRTRGPSTPRPGEFEGQIEHVDLFGLHDGGSRKVPEIFADQDAHPAEAGRIEGDEPFAGGEVALLVEQAVGRQIDLAVQVHDPPALGVQGRVVEAMLRRLFHEAQHHGHGAGGVQELADLRGVGRDGHVRHHIADEVARQRQFREDDQIGFLGPCRLDLLQVQAHVPLPIGQHRRDLGQGHAVEGGAGGGGSVRGGHFFIVAQYCSSCQEWGVRGTISAWKPSREMSAIFRPATSRHWNT